MRPELAFLLWFWFFVGCLILKCFDEIFKLFLVRFRNISTIEKNVWFFCFCLISKCFNHRKECLFFWLVSKCFDDRKKMFDFCYSILKCFDFRKKKVRYVFVLRTNTFRINVCFFSTNKIADFKKHRVCKINKISRKFR